MNNDFSEEDIKKVAKGSGTTFIGNSIGKGLFLLTQIIIARHLGPAAFGLYAIGFAMVKICGILACLGFDIGGMRFVSIYKDEDHSKLKGVLVLSSVIPIVNGIIIGLILYLLSGKIAVLFFHKPELKELLQLFSLSVPFLSGMIVVSSLLRGFHTAKYTVFTRDIAQPLTNILLIIIFYFTGLGLPEVIYAFILSHLIALIIGFSYFGKVFPKIKKRNIKPIYEFKSLISYSIPLLFVGFLHYFLVWINVLLLGVLNTSANVGIYRAASQLPFVMTIFIMATNSIYAPLAANLYHKMEMKRLASIFKTTTRWVIYITLPVFIFLVFSAKELMMIFGRQYIEIGYTALIILSCGQLINCATVGVGMTLTMTGKQNLELLNSIITLFINVFLCYLLIPRYGVIGAAISCCVAVALINLIRLMEIRSIYKMHPFTISLAKYTLLSIAPIAVLFLLNNMDFRLNWIFTIGIKMCIILIFFSTYFIRKNVLAKEDLFVYDRLKDTILRNGIIHGAG